MDLRGQQVDLRDRVELDRHAWYRTVVALASLAIAAVPLPARAKGDLVRVEIDGETLEGPFAIMDPRIVGELFIWTGPGAGQPIGSEASLDSRSFIDWHDGIVAEPKAT